MKKICIFCGRQRRGKSSEHVLPQWLIELTGNPKRTAEFGYEKSEKGEFVKRRFAFNAFKFPSCAECNRKFAILEEVVKPIVQKMMLEDSLSESELSTLLDWFDKVRIGLWLGFLYLNNPLAISPHYYIQHRIRQHDRMLAIFKTDGNIEGLRFLGCDSTAFAQTPSCFSLRINNLWFLNMSYHFLLARRMGFPFPRDTYMAEGGWLYCYLDKGRERIMRPVLRKAISIKGTELYQPIFIGHITYEDSERVKRLYDTEYVRDNCISWEEGIGRIYIKRDSEVTACNTSPSMEWLPEKIHDSDKLDFDMQLLTFEWQSYIMEKMTPSVKLLSEERKREAIVRINLGREASRKTVEFLKEVKRY